MKPKPLVALNHFTVPVVMGKPFHFIDTRGPKVGQAVEFAFVLGARSEARANLQGAAEALSRRPKLRRFSATIRAIARGAEPMLDASPPQESSSGMTPETGYRRRGWLRRCAGRRRLCPTQSGRGVATAPDLVVFIPRRLRGDVSGLPDLVSAHPGACAASTGAVLVRVFIVQHDCGHGSFFASPRANTLIGRLCSLLTLTPFANWSRAGHAASCQLEQPRSHRRRR